MDNNEDTAALIKEIDTLKRVICRQDEVIMMREVRISELTLEIERMKNEQRTTSEHGGTQEGKAVQRGSV